MAKINNYTCAVASWLVFVFVINSKAYADLSSSLSTTETPTTSHSSAFLDSAEKVVYYLSFVHRKKENDPSTTSPPIVLQPNITGALDVGQGLLVPLVPVVDPTSNTTASSPLVASLLPVAVESVPPTSTPADSEFDESNSSSAEIKDDMDVAEDIIFRPLFRYRQEVADRQQSRKYYQPYLYAYRKPNYYNYDSD
ncbi:GSCOCG00007411001-RA-CDS [Cotesia congregata]|nr:GSCOCG00007411001-RA-CDS [Cotesia congregata]